MNIAKLPCKGLCHTDATTQTLLQKILEMDDGKILLKTNIARISPTTHLRSYKVSKTKSSGKRGGKSTCYIK